MFHVATVGRDAKVQAAPWRRPATVATPTARTAVRREPLRVDGDDGREEVRVQPDPEHSAALPPTAI